MGIQDTAQAAADLRYGSQQSALQRKIEAIKAATQADAASLEGYGNRGRAVVDQTYNVLDKYLGQNRTQASQDLGTQVASIGQGYRDAQETANAARTDSRNYLQQLAEKIGGQAALPEQMSTVEDTANRIVSRAAQNDATVTGNLKNWAAQNDSILGQGQAIGQQMRADSKSKFETELLRRLGESRLEGIKGQNDMYGRLSDLLNERGSFLTTEMARLADQEYARQLEQAKLQQAAQQANAELALRSAALASENNARAASQGRASADDARAMEELKLKQRAQDLAERTAAWQQGSNGNSQQEFDNALSIANVLYGNDPSWAVKDTPGKIADLQALGLLPKAFSPQAVVPAVTAAPVGVNVSDASWNTKGYSAGIRNIPKMSQADARRYTG